METRSITPPPTLIHPSLQLTSPPPLRSLVPKPSVYTAYSHPLDSKSVCVYVRACVWYGRSSDTIW